LRILEEKNNPISLKLNITPKYYGLLWVKNDFLVDVCFKLQELFFLICEADKNRV